MTWSMQVWVGDAANKTPRANGRIPFPHERDRLHIVEGILVYDMTPFADRSYRGYRAVENTVNSVSCTVGGAVKVSLGGYHEKPWGVGVEATPCTHTCTQAVMAALRVITSGVAPLADICCKILMALRHSPPLPHAVITELYAATRGRRPLFCIWSSVTMHSFHLPIRAHPARVAWNTPSVLSAP